MKIPNFAKKRKRTTANAFKRHVLAIDEAKNANFLFRVSLD